MERYSGKAIILFFAVSLFAGLTAAAFSINPVSEPKDFSTVSPDSQVVQIVELRDDDGDTVNRSRLESNDNLEFYYTVNGTLRDLDYLKEGYYYASFDTNSTGRIITYKLIDSSPTSGGEINVTENLPAGKLNVNLENNFTGSMEPDQQIDMEATLQDLATYYAVDIDNSGDISEEDEYVLDKGGSGTYSARSDMVLRGSPPNNGYSLAGGNQWSGAEHPLSVNDSVSGDSWDDSNDVILIDRNGGGTVSTQADTNINSGKNSTVNTDSGSSLNDLSSVSSELYFISDDSVLEDGESIVYDNDSDGTYTANPDEVVAGNTPNPGTPVTSQDSMPSELELSSYDRQSGTEWRENEDILALDYDEDGVFSAQSDDVLAGSEPPAGATLNKTRVINWQDGDNSNPTSGNVEVRDANSGDSWDPSSDAIWLENGDSNGYDQGADTPLAGSPVDGMSPTESINVFEQWESISAYQADGEDFEFQTSEDAIIRDYHGGGTYTSQPDFIVAGSITPSFTDGTGFTQVGGFDDDWGLDVIDPNPGGIWNSNQDTILLDGGNGGTFSDTADQVVNSEDGVTASSGTQLNRLNLISSPEKKWSDLDSDGEYSRGDEIFVDHDQDDLYTGNSDIHIGGVSLTTKGSGTPLQTNNPWSNTEQAILFYDEKSGDEWNDSVDAVIRDLDSDGTYTSREDIVVGEEAGSSQATQGDNLLDASDRNLTNPDVTVHFTDGNRSTEPVELGRRPGGEYTNTVNIPDWTDSVFALHLRAQAQAAGIEGTESHIISTRKRGIGFEAGSDIDMDLDRAREFTQNITLENLKLQENTINVNLSDSLQNITTAADSVTLPSNGTGNLTLRFEVIPLESHEGEITFEEERTGITDTVSVEINQRTCESRNDRLCLVDQDQVSVVAESRGDIERELTVQNIWNEDLEVSTEMSGDIADRVTLENDSFTVQDRRDLGLTFSAQEPGNYSGNLELTTDGQTLSVNLSLRADVQKLQKGISVEPGTLDLGTVPEGESATGTVTIENTGTIPISNITFSSSGLNIEASPPETLDEDGETDVDVQVNSIDSESGTVTVTGNTENGDLSSDVEISVSTVPPVDTMKEEIRSTVRDLRSRATSTSTLQDLSSHETKTSSIQTQWDQGNYQQAQSIYDTTTSDLASLETQIQANSDQGTGGETQPEQPQNPDNSGSDNEGGGGGGIIILFILLILILGAGFVIYSSYYPEEGDPLYDVLGDRE